MKNLSRLSAALVVIASIPNAIAQATPAGETDMQFVGMTLIFSYESGLNVKGHYRSATELTWSALGGPSAGSSGSETIQAADIGPGVYFISWVEEAGTTVSQILDFNTSTVTAFVTYETGDGRRGMLDQGTFNVED